MRKWLWTAAVLLVALIAAACGTQTDIPAEDQETMEDVIGGLEDLQDTVQEAAQDAEEAVEDATGEEPTPAVDEVDAVPAGAQTFVIVAEQSEVRFIIDEVLRGEPTTVVGTSSTVSGEIAADYSDLSTAEIGTITIDATTLETDINLRNSAIQRFILETGQEENRFITFVPTAIEGLPDSAEVGETYDVSITGDLTVHGTTNEVTFTGQVTPTSATTIEANMSTTVLYADYDITIPDVPQVASVEDEVILEFDLAAEAQP